MEQAQLLGSRGAFIHECNELGLPAFGLSSKKKFEQSSSDSFKKAKKRLFEAFDAVENEAFFEIWNNPEQIPHAYGAKNYVKLNFRLVLHFNCRQVALEKLTLNDCMLNIREFFDREGSFLASEQEYIHFFALPFVIDPRKHPSFQGLFEVNQKNH